MTDLLHFESPAEVVAYIGVEIVATLEDDLARMQGEESQHYTDEDRAEMVNRIADVRSLAPSLTASETS